MPKQHLEKYLSKYLKSRKDLWYQKNQVNQFAHTKSVGDFLVLSEENNYVVECKEVKIKNSKGVFAFNRLTQKELLEEFDKKFVKNFGYYLIMFWNKNLKKSNIFLINVNEMKKFLSKWNKKSINYSEAKEVWKKYCFAFGEKNNRIK